MTPRGHRGRVAYFASLRRVALPVLGIAGVVLVVALGSSPSGKVAERDLGPDRSLTVAWNRHGFTAARHGGLRFVGYDEVRDVRQAGPQGWFVLIRRPLTWTGAEPHLLALPRDLVPSQGMEALRTAAAGA